jgi:hypothetical protein
MEEPGQVGVPAEAITVRPDVDDVTVVDPACMIELRVGSAVEPVKCTPVPPLRPMPRQRTGTRKPVRLSTSSNRT